MKSLVASIGDAERVQKSIQKKSRPIQQHINPIIFIIINSAVIIIIIILYYRHYELHDEIGLLKSSGKVIN